MAIAAFSSGLTACSAQNQTSSQPQISSPTAVPAGSASMNHDNRSGMNHSMNMDLGAADANFDLRFINAMIPHHQGAVTIAQDALSQSKRPEIQTLSNDTIASQKSEISQMEQWRKAWYNQ
jgi:uncharacterized protein (DUF305 family)